jgi:hypothetical protein
MYGVYNIKFDCMEQSLLEKLKALERITKFQLKRLRFYKLKRHVSRIYETVQMFSSKVEN